MGNTPDQGEIAIRPKAGATAFALLLFGGIDTYLIYIISQVTMRASSPDQIEIGVIVILMLLAYGVVLVDQAFGYVRIDRTTISRVSPFRTTRLPLSEITSAAFVSGGRGLAGLSIQAQKGHLYLQQLSFSKKELQQIQTELQRSCAQINVEVRTGPAPTNIPIKTIVLWGWLYLLAICTFVGTMFWVGLHRAH